MLIKGRSPGVKLQPNESNCVWKFALPPHEYSVSFDMPFRAEILHIEAQNNRPMLWALVDKTAPPERRTFLRIGTGDKMTHDVGGRTLEYIGTVQINGGLEIYHYFERK